MGPADRVQRACSGVKGARSAEKTLQHNPLDYGGTIAARRGEGLPSLVSTRL